MQGSGHCASVRDNCPERLLRFPFPSAFAICVGIRGGRDADCGAMTRVWGGKGKCDGEGRVHAAIGAAPAPRRML